MQDNVWAPIFFPKDVQTKDIDLTYKANKLTDLDMQKIGQDISKLRQQQRLLALAVTEQ